MDIEIIRTSQIYEGGDCTCTYKCKFKKNPTLRQFKDWIFEKRPNEWGDVYLGSFLGLKLFSYNQGKLEKENPKYRDLQDAEVELIAYNGGWSYSAYVIKIV